jgi:hypothetical protein
VKPSYYVPKNTTYTLISLWLGFFLQASLITSINSLRHKISSWEQRDIISISVSIGVTSLDNNGSWSKTYLDEIGSLFCVRLLIIQDISFSVDVRLHEPLLSRDVTPIDTEIVSEFPAWSWWQIGWSTDIVNNGQIMCKNIRFSLFFFNILSENVLSIISG